jgi:asparagine synthase (glutamine-hydrolysing)
MCGLAGFLSSGAFVQGSESAAQLRSMTDALLRRGPDSAGYWLDGDAGIALGHRRLAILDLTESGAQPMRSPCGRFVMVFNGEIYNHLDIRDALASAGAAPVWRGHSDTETLLAGFSTWGIRPTVERAVGMFAPVLRFPGSGGATNLPVRLRTQGTRTASRIRGATQHACRAPADAPQLRA